MTKPDNKLNRAVATLTPTKTEILETHWVEFLEAFKPKIKDSITVQLIHRFGLETYFWIWYTENKMEQSNV